MPLSRLPASLPTVVTVAAALCLVAPVRATAQISIAPTIGVYVPTAELIQAASGQQYKQEVSITVGGRVGINIGQRAGIEATVAYAPSNLRFTASGTSSTTSANILSGSGRAFVELIPLTSPVSLQLNGGVGLVRRSGAAYQGDPNNQDLGGVVGATVRFRLGQVLHLQLHAEDFVYKAQYAPSTSGTGFSVVNKQLNDIHLAVGIGIPLLGLGAGPRH
jgi:hypothetical protein